VVLNDEHILWIKSNKGQISWPVLYRKFREKFRIKVGERTIRRAYYKDSTQTIKEDIGVLGRSHFVIGDVQAKPGLNYPHLHAAGKLIVERRPDVIVNIGDFGDFPSLSSYDRGTGSAEGRRVKDDMLALFEASDILLAPLKRLQVEQAERGEKLYKPRLIWTLGNHENRVWIYENSKPELKGLMSEQILSHRDWEVIPFLKPITVDGVTYIHFMPNSMTGKPYSGMLNGILKNVGYSFVQGHKQCFDFARRDLTNGTVINAVICGAFYTHNEEYKGDTGNHHFRGCCYLHDVKDGNFDIEQISLDRLQKDYT